MGAERLYEDCNTAWLITRLEQLAHSAGGSAPAVRAEMLRHVRAELVRRVARNRGPLVWGRHRLRLDADGGLVHERRPVPPALRLRGAPLPVLGVLPGYAPAAMVCATIRPHGGAQ